MWETTTTTKVNSVLYQQRSHLTNLLTCLEGLDAFRLMLSLPKYELMSSGKYNYHRSELLIDGDGKKSTQKKVRSSGVRLSSLEILPASDGKHRPRRGGVRLAYRDPSGERQRAPSTPQQWSLPSLHRSFRRATASSVHAAAVESAQPTQILPASDSEHRPRRVGVRLAYRDPFGER